jgi:ABC-type uncharacterized transport system permease subunit
MLVLTILASFFYILWLVPKHKFGWSWIAGIIASLFHTVICFYQIIGEDGWILNINNSVLLVALLSVLVVIVYKISSRFVKIPLVLFTILALIFILFYPELHHTGKKFTWQLDLHISLSMLAYSLLSVATLFAVSLWVQIKRLKNSSLLIINNPISILDEEKKLFQLVLLGWLTLTASLLSGAIFITDFLEKSLGHKITFSILAWIVFGVIIFGRLTKGWRGEKLISLVILGMVLLATGYLGSKIVLEYLIN